MKGFWKLSKTNWWFMLCQFCNLLGWQVKRAFKSNWISKKFRFLHFLRNSDKIRKFPSNPIKLSLIKSLCSSMFEVLTAANLPNNEIIAETSGKSKPFLQFIRKSFDRISPSLPFCNKIFPHVCDSIDEEKKFRKNYSWKFTGDFHFKIASLEVPRHEAV